MSQVQDINLIKIIYICQQIRMEDIKSYITRRSPTCFELRSLSSGALHLTLAIIFTQWYIKIRMQAIKHKYFIFLRYGKHSCKCYFNFTGNNWQHSYFEVINFQTVHMLQLK